MFRPDAVAVDKSDDYYTKFTAREGPQELMDIVKEELSSLPDRGQKCTTEEVALRIKITHAQRNLDDLEFLERGHVDAYVQAHPHEGAYPESKILWCGGLPDTIAKFIETKRKKI